MAWQFYSQSQDKRIIFGSVIFLFSELHQSFHGSCHHCLIIGLTIVVIIVVFIVFILLIVIVIILNIVTTGLIWIVWVSIKIAAVKDISSPMSISISKIVEIEQNVTHNITTTGAIFIIATIIVSAASRVASSEVTANFPLVIVAAIGIADVEARRNTFGTLLNY